MGFSTYSQGRRTLAPQTCVGDVFLSTGNGEACLVGTATMKERVPETQHRQVKNHLRGNGSLFEAKFPSEGGVCSRTRYDLRLTDVPSSDFVSLRIQRVKIIKLNDGTEEIQYLDSPNSPFIVFRFEFVNKRGGQLAHRGWGFCFQQTDYQLTKRLKPWRLRKS